MNTPAMIRPLQSCTIAKAILAVKGFIRIRPPANGPSKIAGHIPAAPAPARIDAARNGAVRAMRKTEDDTDELPAAAWRTPGSRSPSRAERRICCTSRRGDPIARMDHACRQMAADIGGMTNESSVTDWYDIFVFFSAMPEKNTGAR
ncbi:hypothetical protein [Herbaspirillum robiniae]|uniref:Uncharacterized protein n=1 Tax=Herbaspirillum robiniae TaxID=2014887 RepID=A0ABX2LSA1_9BURK|nr:hypothetical protein [Herbaspirillum robiniae]NUU01264.1 hypothetical protein [Herbaspirillum robiniae]